MKIETPYLRWHQEMNPTSKKDEGANGPIRSCSLLTINANMGVLATAGGSEVNLWRVGFTTDAARMPSSSVSSGDGADEQNNKVDGASQQGSSSHIMVQPQQTNSNTKDTAPNLQLAKHTKIEHIITLERGMQSYSVNAVKFSPSGQHLVAAGDKGTVVVWSIPPHSTSCTKNTNLFWSTIDREQDLELKQLSNQSEDVMDVAWSSTSKRFTVCSLDRTMNVWELSSKDGDWKKVHHSNKDHTHYIQGVAYDPQGVYLASMGSDRTVKVYSRKVVKESVIKGELAKYDIEKSSTTPTENGEDGEGKKAKEQEIKDKKAIVQTKILPEVLDNSTFTLQKSAKTLKFLDPPKTNDNNATESNKRDGTSKDELSPNRAVTGTTKRHHMFADELTLGSFFRRLSFTTDGAFLVVPAALWHGRSSMLPTSKEDSPASPTSVGGIDKLAESSFATYLFARHHFDKPYKVLAGLEKPSVVIRPNPILFQLPANTEANSSSLPYRSIFAVLTSDTVLIYDTHHNQPLALAKGLHYAALTDAAWSTDGNTLFVTSSDGYLSILSFGNGELGEVYEAPVVNVVEKVAVVPSNSGEKVDSATPTDVIEQPKSNAAVVNTLVARKKEKKTTEVRNEESEKKSVTFDDPLDDRSNQPESSHQPVINTLVARKKKKVDVPPAAQAQLTQNIGDKGSADSTVEKKREADKMVVEEPSVNTLVARKKKKVDGSSTPVATM